MNTKKKCLSLLLLAGSLLAAPAVSAEQVVLETETVSQEMSSDAYGELLEEKEALAAEYEALAAEMEALKQQLGNGTDTETIDLSQEIAALQLQAKEASFAGTWEDTVSASCQMKIACTDIGVYTISITWKSGSTLETCWTLSGTYDKTQGGIVYTGSCKECYYFDEGKVRESLVYENGSGLLKLQDGAVTWEDAVQGAGRTRRFEKVQYEIVFDSDIRRLSEEDFSGMTKAEVYLAWCEIYARHGYVFDDEVIQAYFEEMPWYSANPDYNIDMAVSAVENDNLSLMGTVWDSMEQDEVSTEYADDVLPASSLYLLGSWDMDGLSLNQLDQAVKEIYARHDGRTDVSSIEAANIRMIEKVRGELAEQERIAAETPPDSIRHDEAVISQDVLAGYYESDYGTVSGGLSLSMNLSAEGGRVNALQIGEQYWENLDFTSFGNNLYRVMTEDTLIWFGAFMEGSQAAFSVYQDGAWVMNLYQTEHYAE